MPTVRQASFAGGEVSPQFYGRSDHPRYAGSVRQLLNFLVSPHGSAQNRPGTTFVAEVKDSTLPVRLVPFTYSSTETYLLEFGNLYVRVYGPTGVLYTDIATPFTTAMLPYLKWAQSGNVLTLCYGGQAAGVAAIAPQDLRRIDAFTWTLTATPLVAPTAHVRSIYFCDVNGNLKAGFAPLPDATHLAKQWDWAFTFTVKDLTTGLVSETSTAMRICAEPTVYTDAAETVAVVVSYDPAFAGYVAGYVVLYNGQLWTALSTVPVGKTPGASGNDAYWVNGIVVAEDAPLRFNLSQVYPQRGTRVTGSLIVAVNVYRGKLGVFGLIGSMNVDGNNFLFTDEGQAPDFSAQPPTGDNAFAVKDATGAVTGYDYPAEVAYYQQRRVFARGTTRRERIVGSKTGQLTNFDSSLISQPDDALDFTLSSQQLEEVRSLVSLRALLALTQSGEWSVSGFQGTALAPGSIDASKHTSWGSAWVTPAIVGDSVLFVQDKGATVRDLIPDPYRQLAYFGTDLSFAARHLFEGLTIVDLAYAAVPNSIAWAVRSDGVLLGLTYFRQGQELVAGWHRHTTDGAFENVCSLSYGGEDTLFLVANRTVNGVTKRLIERQATRVISDVRSGVFLDGARTYSGPRKMASTLLITGSSTFAAGDQVSIAMTIASGESFLGVPTVGTDLVIDPDGAAPVRIRVLSAASLTTIVGELQADLPAAYQGAATTNWTTTRRTFTLLDHLAGKTVVVLSDGAVASANEPDSSLVVTGGQITIDNPGDIVVIGLPYTSDLELHDIPGDQGRTAVKSVERVALEVAGSRGLWAGQTFDKLKESRPRQVSDGYGNPALATGLVEVAISSTWNKGGRACFRQVDPLPLTVVAALREVVVGGKD